jgi:hypothetical protein
MGVAREQEATEKSNLFCHGSEPSSKEKIKLIFLKYSPDKGCFVRLF